jgi:hypothetical protein
MKPLFYYLDFLLQFALTHYTSRLSVTKTMADTVLALHFCEPLS